ncbi:MAG TPA: methyltransferase domain-containing protein, partial [Pirellulales bacterium]|nr:methyltransferase domain-containing protein [Pirellulales bacterium]
MGQPERKSSVEEIRQRFDRDVERFSNLETGQQATMDAPLVLELVTDAATRCTPHARRVLDIGCGAGNYTLRLLDKLGSLDVTLVDLSLPMLERARQRVGERAHGTIDLEQRDIRECDFPPASHDIVVAAAVLHHLRSDGEWAAVFEQVWTALRPGGCFWIADLVSHDDPRIQQLMWDRYGQYLVGLKGEAYRDQVFEYVSREDTPRSV